MRKVEQLPVAPTGQLWPQFFAQNGIFTVTWENVMFDFDLLRTDRRTGEASAEVAVYVAHAAGETMRPRHRARLNLLSTSSIDRFARYLQARASELRLDWPGMTAQAVEWTLAMYRRGEPALLLRDAEDLAGGGVPRTAPPLVGSEGVTVHFGDGGAGKSYIALAIAASIHTGRELIAGVTPRAGSRVAYLDWEWSAGVHKRRLRRLWGDEDLPDIVYVPCRLPIRDERDRLRRIIREYRIEFLVVDSVALASGGEPESAEVALGFFGALRELELDALCIAHVTNAAARNGADRPFGSAYWHNSARTTWYLRRQAADVPGGFGVTLYNRKSNDAPAAAGLSLELTFAHERTRIRRSDSTDASAAGRPPLRVRLAEALATSALAIPELAAALHEDTEAVRLALKRGESRQFTRVAGSDGVLRWALNQSVEPSGSSELAER